VRHIKHLNYWVVYVILISTIFQFLGISFGLILTTGIRYLTKNKSFNILDLSINISTGLSFLLLAWELFYKLFGAAVF
jgi:ABC-type methionine transport system permease subunit